MSNKLSVAIVVGLLAFTLTGCGAFWRGAGVGLGAGLVGYEANSKIQMDRLDADLKAGKVTQQEYEIRKDQIKKGSIIY